VGLLGIPDFLGYFVQYPNVTAAMLVELTREAIISFVLLSGTSMGWQL
jgi:hypothetical protein